MKTMFLSMTLICFRGSVCSLRQTKLEYFLVCVCGCVCACGGEVVRDREVWRGGVFALTWPG